MTSELRPAVDVWEDAYRAWDDAPIIPDRIGKVNGEGYSFVDEDRAAAAVIEADREAVRAEQAAEVAKWRDKYNELGQMALEQVSDLGTKLGRTETELDAAKADLQSANRELAKWQALAETLAGALDRIYMEDRRIVERWRQSAVTGDSHLDERIVLGRYAEIAAEALRQYKEARDAS